MTAALITRCCGDCGAEFQTKTGRFCLSCAYKPERGRTRACAAEMAPAALELATEAIHPAAYNATHQTSLFDVALDRGAA